MKCGFYEKEITPPLGGDLPGYFTNRPAKHIKDRLYVKAVVFGNDNDEKKDMSALVVADAAEIPSKYCDRIIARASEYTGIPAENISVSATHTHYGIPCGDVISIADESYMDVFCRLAADCVTMAERIRKTCRVLYGKGRVEGISFIRDYRMRDGNIVTNVNYDKLKNEVIGPNGTPDPELPVLAVLDENGAPMGMLASFACHLDCIGGANYSGDYASELSRCLKAVYGNDFVSIYLAGASGDINHINAIARVRSDYIEIGKALAKEVVQVLEKAVPVQGCVSTKKVELKVKRRHATPKELQIAKEILEHPEKSSEYTMLGGLQSRLLLLYEEEFANGPEEVSLPVHVIRVGDVYLFALPGEIYSLFGKRLKEKCPGGALLSELSNMSAGYIPTEDVFGTSAYPVRLCHGSYLEPVAGQKLIDCALKVAEELSTTVYNFPDT